MNCMKCGREIQADQVFCKECLTEMEHYPVKTDTVVLLPKRHLTPAFKKTHQRRYSPEEQIAALEKRCRRLIAALVISVLLLSGLAVGVGFVVREIDLRQFVGMNYSSTDQTDAPPIVDTP